MEVTLRRLFRRRTVGLLLAGLVGLSSGPPSHKASTSALRAPADRSARQAPESLATDTSRDRLAKLAAAAKTEGSLTLYTTIAEKDLPALLKPFEAKYGVKVVVWRAGTDKVLQRTVAEAAARRYDVDVIHFGSPEMEALSREKILLPVISPTHKDLQPGSVPSHREWAATLLSVWVQAYNTKLVTKDSLPKTYKDLLDPKWKGKLGMEAKDQDWFASVVDVMGGGESGLEFFRGLVATNGSFRPILFARWTKSTGGPSCSKAPCSGGRGDEHQTVTGRAR